MNHKEKKLLVRILLSIFFLIVSFIVSTNEILLFVFCFISYLLVGGEVLMKAIRNLFKGKFLDENFLMSLATVGAFVLKEYFEGVFVMLLYQIGELFQSYAVENSRKSISSLMDIRPDYANVYIGEKLKKVNPETVKVGDLIVVKAGEKIPLDGVVENGEGLIDTSALTGETVPKRIMKKSVVLSGCINKTGLLTIAVTKEFGESTVSKILDLVENASSKKAKAENFITKFAKYYTPIVVILALCLAFLPPIFVRNLTVIECVKRAMTFLVISCPCALVISVPLSFFGGIGGASKLGILVKGSSYLEALSKTKVMVFDKTGTLTRGKFSVTKVFPITISEEKLMEFAAYAELYSNHPIAQSIKDSYKKKINKDRISDVKEFSGKGVVCKVSDKEIAVGNKALMEDLAVSFSEEKNIGTTVYVAVDKKYVGYISISDQIKDEAELTIQKLRTENKIDKIVMLTGDNEEIASSVALQLGVDQYYSKLLPIDKVEKVEYLLLQKNQNTNVAFVGDGINDAPVLTRADIGIAMGALGSDAAIEAADVIIMDDDLLKINEAVSISKRTIKIVKQNIWFAIGIKVVFLILGAFGISHMLEAVFADVGVSILAILNSMRALYVKKR